MKGRNHNRKRNRPVSMRPNNPYTLVICYLAREINIGTCGNVVPKTHG